MKNPLPVLLLLFLTNCSLLPATPKEIATYCENSEHSLKKTAALTLTETVFNFFSVPIELNRGLCEEYYKHREPANGYLFQNLPPNSHYLQPIP